MTVELLVPIARRSVVLNAQGVPMSMQRAQRSEQNADDLAYQLGGREAKPNKPIVLFAADGSPIVLIGAGVADAAELQDLAQKALAEANENIRKRGTRFDFAEARERAGLPRSEDFDRLYRDALNQRVAEHKRNPVTDPDRGVRW